MNKKLLVILRIMVGFCSLLMFFLLVKGNASKTDTVTEQTKSHAFFILGGGRSMIPKESLPAPWINGMVKETKSLSQNPKARHQRPGMVAERIGFGTGSKSLSQNSKARNQRPGMVAEQKGFGTGSKKAFCQCGAIPPVGDPHKAASFVVLEHSRDSSIPDAVSPSNPSEALETLEFPEIPKTPEEVESSNTTAPSYSPWPSERVLAESTPSLAEPEGNCDHLHKNLNETCDKNASGQSNLASPLYPTILPARSLKKIVRELHASHYPREQSLEDSVQKQAQGMVSILTNRSSDGVITPNSARSQNHLALDKKENATSHTTQTPPETTTYFAFSKTSQQAWLEAIRESNTLATQGEVAAARQGLIEIIHSIAQAKDFQAGTRVYTQAATNGFRALQEMDDFITNNSRELTRFDLELIAASHSTPLEKEVLQCSTPKQALAIYHQYAQQQLVVACEETWAGSLALHILGVHIKSIGQTNTNAAQLSHQKAITLQRAAMQVYEGNYLAANELGLLLAQEGYLQQAEELFLDSLTLHPNHYAVHNLEVVKEALKNYPEVTAITTATPSIAASSNTVNR